jgi:hypothetical protein
MIRKYRLQKTLFGTKEIIQCSHLWIYCNHIIVYGDFIELRRIHKT